MNHKFTIILWLFFILTIPNLLISCGVGGVGKNQLVVGTGDLNIEIPSSLNTHLTHDMVLKANINIDGGAKQSLNINRETKQLSGQVGEVDEGAHELVVEFIIVKNDSEVVVANGIINVEIVGADVVIIRFNDFVYIDDDNDGFTNIAELGFDTLLDDPGSRPNIDNIHSSNNYSIVDEPTDEVLINSKLSKSNNYTIQ